MTVWKKTRTPELENKIVKLYSEGRSAKEILKDLEHPFRTPKSIYDILRRTQTPIRSSSETHRRFDRNSNFFSKIETPTQAYILGLMITDGWLVEDTSAIGFSSTDKELADIISIALYGEPHYTVIKAGEFINPQGDTSFKQESYQIQLNDWVLKRDLTLLGLEVKKTFNEILPFLNNNLYPHLIRGILDGDGCIYKVNHNKSLAVNFISGNRSFIKQIQVLLWKELDLEPSGIQIKKNIFRTDYSNVTNSTKLLRWIYQDSEGIRLTRKHKIWKDYEDNFCSPNEENSNI